MFKVGTVELNYFDHPNNVTYQNERRVEIPLGAYFLSKFPAATEVGCVLPHYGWDKHEIIDLTDTHPKNIRANALHWDYKGKDVFSISTLEHFMTREYANGSNDDSIICLNKIIAEAKNYLVTFPTCYNEFLHGYIKTSSHPRRLLKRINIENHWEVTTEDFVDFEFGHRDFRVPDGVFNNANAIWIVTNLPEFHV